jgi:hypothetical protein
VVQFVKLVVKTQGKNQVDFYYSQVTARKDVGGPFGILKA